MTCGIHGFRVIHSNSTERLVEALVEDCKRPLADPMQPELILVQNPGMARWLSQQFAERTGIAANLKFPLPASFIWQLQQSWLGETLEQGRYDRESLRWWLMQLIPQHLDEAGFEGLNGYLGRASADNLRLYQLAGRIADLFDQYLVYRPQMLLGWETGKVVDSQADAIWQARLWQALVAASGGEHRARLFERFLQASESAPKGQLPERLSLFGLSALPPVYLEALKRLATQAQVNLYLQNPCKEYWFDILDERQQAKKRARWRIQGKTDISSLMDVGNPLLAANGQMAQMLVDQLLELDIDSEDAFEPPRAPGLLGQIQSDILNLVDSATPDPSKRRLLGASDTSLQVHGCHSQLREIQVLHDILLRTFEELDGLRPHQVVVMAPNISDYAPWVEAVFGGATGNSYIPWSIADTGQIQSPLYKAIDSLLQLPGSRFAASELLSLLEVPAIMARFRLDADALERIRTWVHESGIRWSADGAMRTHFDVPEEAANSWDFGLQRLFYGYALPPDAGLCQGVLPYPDIEGSEAEGLGQLASFVEQLGQWRERLAQPATASVWQGRINQLISDFIQPQDGDEQLLQSLRHALATLVEKTGATGYGEPLELDIIRSEIATALNQRGSTAGFLIGRVTFCNLVPMRGIPFRVLCLLGLNDGAFPRHDPSPGFNLMAAHPVIGDRSKRLDDRYLFLEALLSARERLLLFYQSRSAKDNKEQTASVVLSELLDSIKAGYRMDTSPPTHPPEGEAGTETAVSSEAERAEQVLAHLITQHPLQPFSRRYFDGQDARLFSYDGQWLAAIQNQTEEIQRVVVAPTGMTQLPPLIMKDHARFPHPNPLPKGEGENEHCVTFTLTDSAQAKSLSLQDLIRFLQNPADWYLRHGLGARDAEESLLPEDDEPFALDGLGRYDYKSRLLAALLADEDAESLREYGHCAGTLPPGNLGVLAFNDLADAMTNFADRIGPVAQKLITEPLEIDLRLGETRLHGWLAGLSETGLLQWRPSNIKAKDRLRFWVQHLAFCLWAGSEQAPRTAGVEAIQSRLLMEDKTLSFDQVSAEDACRYLEGLIDLWHQGQLRPLPFFPAASLTFAEALYADASEQEALHKASKAWEADSYDSGPETLAVACLFQGQTPLEHPEFADLAKQVFEPLLKHGQLEKS